LTGNQIAGKLFPLSYLMLHSKPKLFRGMIDPVTKKFLPFHKRYSEYTSHKLTLARLKDIYFDPYLTREGEKFWPLRLLPTQQRGHSPLHLEHMKNIWYDDT